MSLTNKIGDRQTTRNLLRGGIPALLSSVITALIPAAGVLFLTNDSYAVWALAATLTTIFLLVDFGTTSLSTKLAAESSLTGRSLAVLYFLTALPPILLTGLVLAIWPAYSRAAGLQYSSDPRVFLLIGMVGLGTAFRSFGLIGASVALGRRQFGRRSLILLGGAVLQAAATVVALLLGADFVSLGAGVALSGVFQLVVALALAPPDAGSGLNRNAQVWPLIRRFASVRGAAVILGIAVTQLDRWSLGLFAGAAILTVYDVAIRFATMPKIALLAFGSGLITESSGQDGAKRWGSLFSRYTKIFGVLALLGAVVATPLSIAFAHSRTNLSLGLTVAIILIATIGHGVNAVTIPASFLSMGMGRPELELLYLLPLALLAASGYLLGNLSGSALVQLFIWGGALCLTSVAFIIWFNKIITRGIQNA